MARGRDAIGAHSKYIGRNYVGARLRITDVNSYRDDEREFIIYASMDVLENLWAFVGETVSKTERILVRREEIID